MPMDNHKGHRKRMKNRYSSFNFENFAEHELVELILFYSIPRKNTNEIAHALLERFGTINRMAEASIDELKLVNGVGDNSAVLIKLILSCAKKYAEDSQKPEKRLNTIDKAVYHANMNTMGAVKELVYATFLDNSLNVIDTNLIAVGTIDEVAPPVRTIVELSILKRADAVMIMHNHPGGCVEASPADIHFTMSLEQTLSMIGVHLVEHIIVGGTEHNTVLKNIRKEHKINDHIDMKTFYG